MIFTVFTERHSLTQKSWLWDAVSTLYCSSREGKVRDAYGAPFKPSPSLMKRSDSNHSSQAVARMQHGQAAAMPRYRWENPTLLARTLLARLVWACLQAIYPTSKAIICTRLLEVGNFHWQYFDALLINRLQLVLAAICPEVTMRSLNVLHPKQVGVVLRSWAKRWDFSCPALMSVAYLCCKKWDSFDSVISWYNWRLFEYVSIWVGCSTYQPSFGQVSSLGIEVVKHLHLLHLHVFLESY